MRLKNSISKAIICSVIARFALASGEVTAQVSNNSISSRSQLVLDESPINSTTNNSTVEWQCVNKKLTGKCLVYHNDQWFTFKPSRSGKYYINISAKSCRDNRGIQAIVIQGNPCEVSTYKILKCVSQIRFQDASIEIDSMEASATYLINIDGFLEDDCQFSIQFSSNPHGVSVDTHVVKKLQLSGTTAGGIETLVWKLPLSLTDSIVSFSVYRKSDMHHISTLSSVIPLKINAKGEYQTDYTYIDSVQGKRPYSYQIIGNLVNDSQIALDEWFVQASGANNSNKFRISFELDYKDKSKLQILLVDATHDLILSQTTLNYSAVLDKNQNINVRKEVSEGIRNFKVLIVDLKSKRNREMLFFVDDQGRVTTR